MKDAIGLLSRREVGRFAFEHRDLTLSDVDELLVGHGLRFPTFRVVRGAEACDIEAVAQGATDWGIEQVEGIVRPQEVYRHLREGWTLVLDQLHRQWGPVGVLNRRFEAALAGRSRVDVLVVPDGATPPAHEQLDRVVMCLAGEAGVQVQGVDHRLAEGQALVVPVGTQMTPLPASGLTLIAVVAIQRITWREVLMDALANADAPVWHDAVQMDASGPKTLSEDEQQAWDASVEALLDELDAEDALERIAGRIVSSRLPLLRNQFQMQGRDVGDDTPMRRRPEVMYRIVEEGNDTFLVFHSHRLQFGVGARRVLELIAEAPLFRPADLPGIPVEQRVPLCMALVRSGFLTLDIGR